MARITVEDCVDRVPNKFRLVLLAARRAYEIAAGAPVLIARNNDKDPVVALREIAGNKISINELESALLQAMKRTIDKESLDSESFMHMLRRGKKDSSSDSFQGKTSTLSDIIFEDIDPNSSKG